MKFTVFAAFLFSIGWMSVALAAEGAPPDCCLTVSNTRIPAENIVGYTIQDAPPCKIRAVRFHTKKDKVICSDPNDNWAKRVMKIVDGRLTTIPSLKHTTCYTSTKNVIPTTATTDETSGTETEISTSTTVPTRVTTSTPETETEISTSTTVTSAVTTIRTSEPKTSTSTSVPPTVTTTETSTPETEISTTTMQPTSVSTGNTESTATTCGTSETTATQTETTPETKTKTTGETNTTKKMSKMMKRKKGKSRKGLRRVQISLKSTPGHLNTSKSSV